MKIFSEEKGTNSTKPVLPYTMFKISTTLNKLIYHKDSKYNKWPFFLSKTIQLHFSKMSHFGGSRTNYDFSFGEY